MTGNAKEERQRQVNAVVERVIDQIAGMRVGDAIVILGKALTGALLQVPDAQLRNKAWVELRKCIGRVLKKAASDVDAREV